LSPEIWSHSFIYGGILAGLMFLFIMGSMIYNRELWLNDYPPDIRKKYGEPSEKTLKQRKFFGVAMLAMMIIVLLADGLTLQPSAGDKPTFLLVFRSLVIVFLMGSLMDLLVIDLFFGMVIRPKFMILPGTEGMAGYRDVKFHFNAFVRGALSGAVLCLILAGVVSLVNLVA